MKFSRAILSLITLIMTAAFVACGGGGSSSPPPPPPNPALPDGTYVFSLAGQDASTGGFPYYVAGAFKVKSGTITGGEQDFDDFNVGTVTDNITGGNVTKSADGNLRITLTTGDNFVGLNGVETLSGTLVSNTGSKALITEFDASATSSGELDLQTTTTAGQGGFAFFVTGADVNAFPVAMGGVVNVDGSGTISGSGSVFDINDVGDGILLQSQPIDPSTASAPDAFGRVQVSLNLTTSTIGGIVLVGYVVDNDRIRLVENNNDPNTTFQAVMGGTAFAQGANTGSFSAASIAGSSLVFGTNGLEPIGFFQVAGVVSANNDLTTVGGTLNFNDLTGVGAQAPIAFAGTYAVDPTGRVTVQDTTDGFTFEMYLDGNGSGAVVSMDDCTGVACDVLAGLAYQQTGAGSFNAASFSGSYGLGATGIDFDGVNSVEVDSVGPVTADGVGALNGIVDQNSLSGAPTTNVALTGDFVVDPSGVFTTNNGIKGLDVLIPANQDAFTYYLIDNQRAVAIETDPNQLTLGYFELVH